MKIPAILLAGGKNSRFDFSKVNYGINEKLLLPLGNRYIIDFSIKTILDATQISQLTIATSPNAKATHKYLVKEYSHLTIIKTKGNGYLQDIHSVVKNFNLGKVITIVGDAPFITSQILDSAIKTYLNLKYEALSIMIPVKLLHNYGFNISSRHIFIKKGEKVISTGINLLDGRILFKKELDQMNIVSENINLMYNINTIEDYNRAKEYYKKIEKNYSLNDNDY